MKIYIICPVRNRTNMEEAYITRYVVSLEMEGHKVFLPFRDNIHEDADKTGLLIYRQNIDEIKRADRCDVWWNNKSEGIHFDLGAAFALHKQLKLINRDRVLLNVPNACSLLADWEKVSEKGANNA